MVKKSINFTLFGIIFVVEHIRKEKSLTDKKINYYGKNWKQIQSCE